jgi:hypothetical protein
MGLSQSQVKCSNEGRLETFGHRLGVAGEPSALAQGIRVATGGERLVLHRAERCECVAKGVGGLLENPIFVVGAGPLDCIAYGQAPAVLVDVTRLRPAPGVLDVWREEYTDASRAIVRHEVARAGRYSRVL